MSWLEVDERCGVVELTNIGAGKRTLRLLSGAAPDGAVAIGDSQFFSNLTCPELFLDAQALVFGPGCIAVCAELSHKKRSRAFNCTIQVFGR